jgi:type VI secretion system ImpC/EvpB family protein
MGVTYPASSLLDEVLDAAAASPVPTGAGLDRFLHESCAGKALAAWLGPAAILRGPALKERVAQRLSRDIARLDALLSRQTNAILHHPTFQRLEASWRGLRYLVTQVPEGANIKIRVLNVTWKELARDLERAIEFDQSQLFRKVYEDEFGTPGGEPFGVLLGDYEVRHSPTAEHPVDDLGALASLASVAAAAFAPFIAGVHPSLLDLKSFIELERPLDLAKTFEQVVYVKWRAFRLTEDARFVGLVMPRVLMRLPYADDNSRVDGFRFREDVEDPSRKEYLWGNAIYAFGSVLIQAFAESGWLAGIRGVQRGIEGGGLVMGLPAHSFSTDKSGIAPKCSTDAIIADAHENELAELGFIPLCHCQGTEFSAFYSNQSVQRPRQYDEVAASVNARLSAMLQYMLCVSRFAHYLKIIGRDMVGRLANPAECEEQVRRWLQNYISNDNASPDLKARRPLGEARVRITERPGQPGNYVCVAHLRPHYQLDQLVAAVRLVTDLSPIRSS